MDRRPDPCRDSAFQEFSRKGVTQAAEKGLHWGNDNPKDRPQGLNPSLFFSHLRQDRSRLWYKERAYQPHAEFFRRMNITLAPAWRQAVCK